MGLPDAAVAGVEVLVASSWDCNLRCTYCFLRGHTFACNGPRFCDDDARRLIDALDAGFGDAETICVHLYGGEPLLHPAAIRAMLERTREKPQGRFTFAITTNGTVCSDEAIALLDEGRFDVILSVDGPPQVHDECRRTAHHAPTHGRVMRFLQALRTRTDCRVRGSAVVRSGWGLADAEAYLRTLPVDTVKAQAIRVPADDPHALGAAEREAYVRDLERIGDQVISDLERGSIPLDDRYSSRVLQLLKGESRDRFCGAGRSVFGVTPTGDVRPCLLVEGETLGRIGDPPRRWREAGERWRAAHRARPECDSCDAMPLCGGGCPAMLAVCGADECDLVRANCRVARRIFDRFRDRPLQLLPLAGIA